MTSAIKLADRIFQSIKFVHKSGIGRFLMTGASAAAVFILSYSVSMAQSTCEDWVAKVVSIEGMVMVQRAGETAWKKAEPNQALCMEDLVIVGERSRAAIVTRDNSLFRLDQKTTVTFSGFHAEKSFFIRLFNGAVHFFSRTPGRLEVTTPFVNAAVGGTEFLVRVEKERTFLHVFEGKVSAINDMGALALSEGQSAVAREGEAPLLQIMVYPRDAIQWALYYPPILDFRPSDFEEKESKDSWRGMVQNSLNYYWKGDIAGAFSSLPDSPENISDPRFYTYKAALLLSVGRVEEAHSAIAEAFLLDPKNANAMALESIIALAQNRTEQAYSLASDAVMAAPESAVPRVALSYAQQARFELESALESLNIAVSLSPDNELALARLAELLLSLGYLDRALEEARRAVNLNPRLARTQTVLGFANLTQIEIEDAKNAFERAILLDQADPWPRLGLGLAKIREGDLEEGRRQIEIAVILDPNNSLIRSYLGKAYFDEKRGELAKEQFTAAKRLDPNDPTPYFYDAIRKQTENRPVEALEDLQKSIELNDNRAVYRSRLQLDEDLAARSAALGRIYQNLNFEQLALIEGWKSVNTDPGNYSAHRLLADTYSAVPRHEIARVSELLQSQLLQPINITPVQPHLAETNLFILEGAGPSELSFNEFNPLFLRNRFAFQGSGVVGGNDTLGDELVHSAVWNRISYSLGQFHYETDGFRDNNDREHDIYNALTQVRLSHKTSIQGEIRHSSTEKGDLELTFLENFNPDLRQKEEVDSLRVGFRRDLSPKASVIASLIHQSADIHSEVVPGFFELESDGVDYSIGEVRLLFESAMFNATGGFGHRRKDETLVATFAGFPSEERLDPHHTNFYIYSQVSLLDNLDLTLGGSADFYSGATQDEDREQFNPKVGLVWNPAPSTTVRAAAFRTLLWPLLSEQEISPTLEPTQVAGFNQYYFGVEGEEAWQYGAAVDQKFADNLYGGVALFARDLDVPIIDARGPSPVIRDADWKERVGSAYLYWTPSPRLSLSAEYLYEKFERDPIDGLTGAQEFIELKTHRIPLGIRFFTRAGFTAGLEATYVNQKGDFNVFNGPFFSVVKGEDDFWVLDASIGYRLPERHGFLSLEAKNLLDEEFRFQDTDPGNPRIMPDRLILFKLTLAF